MLKTTNFIPKNLLKTKEDIYFNAKTKHYPSGLDKVSVSNKRVYKDKAYESRDYKDRNRPTKYNLNGESRQNNVNAVKVKIFDIALINKFTHFITLTFDQKKIDRYDDEEIKAKLKIWLKNAVARKDLKYLLIPERHKDGAIHCHALVSGNLDFVDSGIVNDYGKPIYNISDWKYGFSTAFEITDENGENAFIKYVTKYITKESKKIFGNYYLAGGKGLKRDVPCSLSNMDYYSVDAEEHIVPLGDYDLKFKNYFEESRLINLCQKLQTTV